MLGAPAFAVTLAGLLFWLGFMLQTLGENGTINLDSEGFIGKLTTYFFTDIAAAYGLAAVVTAVFFITSFLGNRRREAAGIPSRPLNETILRTALLAVISFAAAFMYNQYKGLPLATVIFLVFLVATDFVLRRTSYGRKVFALGGSVEASRARRHQRHRGADLGLRDLRRLRGDRRPLPGLQDRLGQPERRYR
ncbi:Xylose transport system permease protein XylH [Streptomyces glaucescens]